MCMARLHGRARELAGKAISKSNPAKQNADFEQHAYPRKVKPPATIFSLE
jgi:hypothetical protein